MLETTEEEGEETVEEVQPGPVPPAGRRVYRLYMERNMLFLCWSAPTTPQRQQTPTCRAFAAEGDVEPAPGLAWWANLMSPRRQ